MNRQFKQVSWLALWTLLISFPFFAYAAEAPGALTVIVKDQNTDRPVPNAQVTITERETSSTQTFETDEKGRIVAEQLDPGLYSVNAAKAAILQCMNQAYASLHAKISSLN